MIKKRDELQKKAERGEISPGEYYAKLKETFSEMTPEERAAEEMKLAASILGRKGGKAKSEKKTAAVRENAKKGGRPKTVLCPRCEMVKIKIDDAAGTCKFCQEEMETEIKRSQENYDRAMK